MSRCGYCLTPKSRPGWHGCPQSVKGRKALGDILIKLHEQQVGGPEPVMGRTEAEERYNQAQRAQELESHRVGRYVVTNGERMNGNI